MVQCLSFGWESVCLSQVPFSTLTVEEPGLGCICPANMFSFKEGLAKEVAAWERGLVFVFVDLKRQDGVGETLQHGISRAQHQDKPFDI